MGQASVQIQELAIISVAGPTPVSLALAAPGPVTIGRAPHQTLDLPDPRVSREHASLTCRELPDGAEWSITDRGSRHGTWLNGVRLTPAESRPIRGGDLIVISPWTFRIRGGDDANADISIASLVDSHEGTITRLDARAADALAQERLALLLQCATAIHSVTTEQDLAEAVLEAVVSGTGFSNAAVLRGAAEGDQIEILAHRGAIIAGGQPSMSRSLLRQASEGVPARLASMEGGMIPTHSLVEYNIGEALCIPLMIEGVAAGFIYLDNRGRDAMFRRVSGDAAAYAIGVARLANLSLANLRRVEVERRNAAMQAELSAAGRMQGLLLPPRTGQHGALTYTGESRPGRFVGGDFFDVITLADGRLAIALGDVAGKGVEASVLITASQGFLNSALQQHGDIGRALTELNRYVNPRCPLGKFITLWAGVFDAASGTLDCIDAGHGHMFFLLPDGTSKPIGTKKHYPLAVLEDTHYEAERVPLPPGGRAVIISDGLLEEMSERSGGSMVSSAEQFSMERVKDCIAAVPPGGDEIAALFRCVQTHAGREELQDDATAVVVHWDGNPASA